MKQENCTEYGEDAIACVLGVMGWANADGTPNVAAVMAASVAMGIAIPNPPTIAALAGAAAGIRTEACAMVNMVESCTAAGLL